MIKGDQSEKLPEKNAPLKLERQVQEKAWRQKHNNMQTRMKSLDRAEDSPID